MRAGGGRGDGCGRTGVQAHQPSRRRRRSRGCLTRCPPGHHVHTALAPLSSSWPHALTGTRVRIGSLNVTNIVLPAFGEGKDHYLAHPQIGTKCQRKNKNDTKAIFFTQKTTKQTNKERKKSHPFTVLDERVYDPLFLRFSAFFTSVR